MDCTLSFLFHEIEKNITKKIPFAVYRKPNDKVVTSYIQKNDEVYFLDDFEKSGFVFAPFNSLENSIIFPIDCCKIIKASSFDTLVVDNIKNTDVVFEDSEVLKKNHLKLVQKGIDFIKSGFAKKIVLSRKEIINVEAISIVTIFEKMLLNYQNAFVYCWFHPKIGLWLGATPEKLLEISNKTIKTVSLAGTQLKLENFNHLETKWGEKELEEQQIVTDFMVEQLKTHVDKISLNGPISVTAGKMVHLSTTISGEMIKPYFLKNIINCLHPTPAICGFPKDKSLKFIIENEGYHREFYSGYLGELNVSKKTELFVNLRCMKVKENTVALYVGGGITSQSEPQKEWEETVFKTQTIKAIL
ncbi:chorismate-binding protein [Lutibacter sp.]|uniref:chorismate-binding protein n=1 Tax=Lutibacter sp. TaxID=1925666 RepID=UPI002737674D|nr:chorismate-binding protein [Lutibacter sp.]MDP3312494.1 chorismate-binding protein [Lutibacter sp.]